MPRVTGLFALALIVVAACGSDGGPTTTPASSSTPDNPDVCSLLTVAEIEEITGIDDAPIQNRDRPSFPSYECYWGGVIDSVDVVLIRLTAGRTPDRNPDAEEIEDLGEYAQYYAEPIPGLEVWDGAWYINVSPITLELARSQNERDASVELARLILERLD